MFGSFIYVIYVVAGALLSAAQRAITVIISCCILNVQQCSTRTSLTFHKCSFHCEPTIPLIQHCRDPGSQWSMIDLEPYCLAEFHWNPVNEWTSSRRGRGANFSRSKCATAVAGLGSFTLPAQPSHKCFEVDDFWLIPTSTERREFLQLGASLLFNL